MVASAQAGDWRGALDPYVALAASFVHGQIDADEFEAVFLSRYKADDFHWPVEVFDQLDGLFAAVDDYCSDPDLRADVGGLDAEALRAQAAIVLAHLRALLSAR